MDHQIMPLGGEEFSAEKSDLAEIVVDFGEFGIESEERLELVGFEGRRDGRLEGR